MAESANYLPCGRMRRLIDRSYSEKEFQRQIVELAEMLGWYVYHTFDARRSQRGFPDLALIRPPRLIFAEVKRQKGKVSEHQAAVLELLNRCPHVESYVWRPSDWPQIERLLSTTYSQDRAFEESKS